MCKEMAIEKYHKYFPLLTVLIVCKNQKKNTTRYELQRKSIPTAINRHLSISAIAQSILSTTNCSKCLNRFHLDHKNVVALLRFKYHLTQ